MTLEQLKADYPELVEAIRNEALNEGANNERTRIQAIHALGITGHDELVADAIANGKTAGDLAIAYVEAENAKKEILLKDRADDAANLNGVTNSTGNEGLIPGEENKQQEKAERDAIIAAGKSAFFKN